MKETLIRKARHVGYLYHGDGAKAVALQLARKLMAPLYQRERQYISIHTIQDRDPLASLLPGAGENLGIECLVVETPEALRGVEAELPSATLADHLRTRLAQGSIVVLARQAQTMGGGKKVVGYGVCQRGVFSALGRTGRIAADILFSHYTEVLPAYRGQRIFQLIREAQFEYCRGQGLKKLCGVATVHNRSAILARTRTGEALVGTVERVALLGGLFVWETPWERIEQVLRSTTV